MDRSGYSAGERLTSTISRSLDSMYSSLHYACTSGITTIKRGQLLEESANYLLGQCVWSMWGSSSRSPVSSSNEFTQDSTQTTSTQSSTMRKRNVKSGTYSSTSNY
jgi:hypothetical protein